MATKDSLSRTSSAAAAAAAGDVVRHDDTRLDGGPAALYVAASTAPAAQQARADWVCDGTADDVQIQAAIDAAAASGAGTVLLSPGTFILAAEVALLGADDVDVESWVSLEGAGPMRTTLTVGSGLTAGIRLAQVWKGRVAQLSLSVAGASHGIRAVATNNSTAGWRSFWGSTLEDLQVAGPWDGSHTGWGLHLESPFRSTLRNIEIAGVGNGIRLFSSNNNFNPGDCVFTRCFVDSLGNTKTAYSIESTVASGNMNQVVFEMCEAICSGTGCTGIYLGGSGGTPGPVNHTEWIGTNLEGFDTIVNIDRGEGNALSLNYITTRGTNGMTAIKFGNNAYHNRIRRIGMLYSANTVTLVNDTNTALPAEPNTVEDVKIYADTGSTINYSRNAAGTTILRNIVGDGPGSFAGGLLGTSVTNLHLADMATATFKGRTTAGTGDPEDLTATQATALLDTATTTIKGLMSAADKKRQSQVYDAQADFGFVGDLQSTVGTSALTGTALTDSTNPFTAADVGKRVTVPRAGAGSGVNAAQLTTTIAAYVNAGQVTLTVGATNNVATASVHWGTDNSAAEALLVSTINGLAWSGARVVFGNSPTNSYGVQTNWVFNKTCWIEGIGGGWTADAGTLQMIGGTRLVWWGTSSDGGTAFQAMITFTPTGANNLKRVTLRNLWLDCYNNGQNSALYGVKLASCHGHRLENVYVMDALAQGIWTDIDSDPTEAKDTTRFLHQHLCFRQLDPTPGANTTPTTTSSALTWSTSGQSMTIAAANSLRTSGYVWVQSNLGYPVLVRYTGGGGTTTLTGCTVSAEDVVNAPASYANAFVVEATPSNGGAYKLAGGSGANTNSGVIDMVQISYGTTFGPAAMEFNNSDSIVCRQIIMNGGSNTTEANGNRQRRPGVRFNGSNTSSGLASRNNVFYDGDPGGAPGGPQGGCSSMGLNNAGANLSFPAGPNKWYNMQLGNGAPVPIMEGNSQLVWTGNGILNTAEVGPVVTTTTTVNATSAILARIQLPPQWAQIGLTVRCVFPLTKTAAGTAARVTGVKLGTAGTTADTTVNSVSRTPTATADEGVEEITWSLVGPLGASCTSVLTSRISKGLTGSTGLFNVAAAFDVAVGTPVTFNSAGGQTWLSFFMTTGTAEVVTVAPPVIVEVLKGASP